MKTLIVIPARYASTRFPGKPLVALTGSTGVARSLIERSWHAALAVNGADRVVVATDDTRIEAAAKGFGAEVVMTSPDCQNGTERCAEAHASLGGGYDLIVNLQGDAPLTPPWFVEALTEACRRPEVEVATPVLPTRGDALDGFLSDRRAGRVGGTTTVFGMAHQALYFSKEVIPYQGRTYAPTEMTPVWHHVGVYAYKPDALSAYPALTPGPLETLEGLEQLRFMEHGHPVTCVPVDARERQFWELNNPQDVARIETMMQAMGIK